MHTEHGGIPTAVLVLIVGLIVVVALTFDACFDDPDETDDLGHRTSQLAGEAT